MLPHDIIQYIFDHVPLYQRWKFARLCKYTYQRSIRDPLRHKYYASYTLVFLDYGRRYRQPSMWRWKRARNTTMQNMAYFYFLQGLFACPYQSYRDQNRSTSPEHFLDAYLIGAMHGGTLSHYNRIEDALYFICHTRIGMRICYRKRGVIRRRVDRTRRHTSYGVMRKLQQPGAFVCCDKLCDHLLTERDPYHISKCSVCFRSRAPRISEPPTLRDVAQQYVDDVIAPIMLKK